MPYPNTGAPEWAAAQATPWNSVNEAAFIFDAFASRSIVEDRDLTAPPVSCANGARYLIAATATGAWATHDGELAIAIGANASNGWYFADVARHGNQLFVRDEDLLIEHNGSAWVTAPGGVSSLNDLTDVDAPTPTGGDVLTFVGGDWIAAAPALSLPAVATDADDYTVLAAHNNLYIRLTGAAAKSITVQDDATEPLPANGEWHFRNVGAGDATFAPAGGVTIHAPVGGSLVVEQGGTVTLKRVAADEFDLIGVTAAP